MSRRITAHALAAAMLTLTALAAQPVFAKGGQDNYERQQALQAEFEKSRTTKTAQPATGLFDLLFGLDETESAKASEAKQEKPASE